jgi:hypothetical protein
MHLHFSPPNTDIAAKGTVMPLFRAYCTLGMLQMTDESGIDAKLIAVPHGDVQTGTLTRNELAVMSPASAWRART